MKVIKRERSPWPVYLIALVWIFAAFAVGIHTVWGYLAASAVSVAAYFIGRAIFPDRQVETEVPDPEPADPELAALKKGRARDVGEIRRLNDNIEDPEISAHLDHIEMVTGKIYDYLLEHPEKRTLVRRFLDYYLPTTIKLLNQYDRMDGLGLAGENVSAAKEKIGSMLSTVSAAFDKQLDSLFQDDYMDISAEITVLEQMMAQEGLTGSEMQ
ncbi:MAG: 5-bromo-4-chloroindolyl phosphate hydrolysis family protein [Clostridiales bacterium]|nr:5-bromo-4-chloroindolyl phosphate hydrolysis family protein [Clostridiales bacterium]